MIIMNKCKYSEKPSKMPARIRVKNCGQNKFCDIAQQCPLMLISVKMARPISFFSPKDAQPMVTKTYQKRAGKSLRILTGDAKNEIMGPSGPPPPIPFCSMSIHLYDIPIVVDPKINGKICSFDIISLTGLALLGD